MTIYLDPNSRFANLEMRVFREILKTWTQSYRSDGASIAQMRKVERHPGVVLAALAEAKAAGLLVEQEDARSLNRSRRGLELSNAGEAVVYSAMSKRAPKKTAQAVVNNILERADRLNADPKAPYLIDEIWLFGSMIDSDKKDVGDIDIVLVRKPSPVIEEKGLKEYTQIDDYIIENYPDRIPQNPYALSSHVPETFIQKSLFGPRRHPLIAENCMSILQQLHRPCGKIFDSKEGGRIPLQVLPHHPESKGRGSGIKERLVTPTLPDIADTFSFVPASDLEPFMRSGRDTRCRGLRDPSSSTIIFEKVDDQGRKYGVRVERTLERSEDDLTLDFKLSVFGDFPDEAVFIPNGYHPFELEIEQVVICEFFRLVSFRGAHAPSANVEMTFRSSRNENAQFLKDRLGVHLEETFVFKRWPAVFEEKDDYRWEAPAGYGSTVVGLERDIPLADLSPSIGSAT